MEKTDRDIDEFLASLPDDQRDDMVTLDSVIAKVMAGETRVLYEGRFWGGSDQEIIGYGTMTTTRSDKRTVEWFLVGLALQKHYISVYVSAVEDREYLSEKYGKDLGKVKVGKSSISFKSIDDIDLDKLAALVQRARDIAAEPA